MSIPLALVIEDDHALSRTYERVLISLGYRVQVSHSIADARQTIRDLAPELILVDIELPDGNGLDLMDELRNSTRERFIVISGNSSQRSAIKSIRHRAVEFVSKPVSLDNLKRLIGEATSDYPAASDKNAESTARTPANPGSETNNCWINHGNSTALVELRTAISFSAELRKGHALIAGEPGLEKYSIAMELHKRSRRSGKIVFIDCAAKSDVSTSLYEHLFGYADNQTGTVLDDGCIAKAAGGTLVLGNVDGLTDELQSALSLFLDTGIFRRSNINIGFKATLAVVGILSDQAKSDSLRADFRARLSQISLNVPSLRDCTGDVIPISRWLLKQILDEPNDTKIRYTMSEAMENQISEARWQHNIVELRTTIQAAVDHSTKNSNSILELQLPEPLQQRPWEPLNDLIGLTLRDFGNRLVVATLAHHHGDKARAAETLGISLKTLYNRLNSY